MKNNICVKLLIILLICCACLVPKCSLAQQADTGNVAVARIITIHSKILNQDRKIYIYTPALGRNRELANQPCPVLYLMDGEVHAAFVSSEVNYLSVVYTTLPPMIVVGIGNYAYDRMHDLTPTHYSKGDDGKIDSMQFKTTGGGEKFLQFIKEEVMPYVQSHYKTEPFSIFSGHSLGGLMSAYCLANHPDMFNAYISVSPALWVDDASEIKDFADHLQPAVLQHKFFFMSDGSEGGNFHKAVVRLDSILKRRNINGFAYKYVNYPDETHGSEPVKAIYDGLRLIYPDWDMKQTDTTAPQIKSHYQKLTDRYGYKIMPPEGLINYLGYNLLNTPDKLDQAVAYFQLNVDYYPASANVYDSLGDALAKKGEKAKAIANYRKALSMNPNSAETKGKLDVLVGKR